MRKDQTDLFEQVALIEDATIVYHQTYRSALIDAKSLSRLD